LKAIGLAAALILIAPVATSHDEDVFSGGWAWSLGETYGEIWWDGEGEVYVEFACRFRTPIGASMKYGPFYTLQVQNYRGRGAIQITDEYMVTDSRRVIEHASEMRWMEAQPDLSHRKYKMHIRIATGHAVHVWIPVAEFTQTWAVFEAHCESIRPASE